MALSGRRRRRARRVGRLTAAVAVAALGVALVGLPAGGSDAVPPDGAEAAGDTPPAADTPPGADTLPATEAVPAGGAEAEQGAVTAEVAVLDVAVALAALVSSDGTLPLVAEVAAPQDGEGLYLAPDPGPAAVEGALLALPVAPAVSASLGAVGEVFAPASVIGTDERSPVPDPTAWPFRAIAHVTSASTNCTGWLVGPDLVLTAGHCVHDYSGFARSVTVVPGRSGDIEPFGRCGATRAYTTRAFVETGDLASDWGIIELDCRVGERTGWFGLRAAGDDVVGRTVVVSGYPMDRPRGTQWWAAEQVRAAYPGQLAYGGDTYAGQSGSPVHLTEGSCVPCGVAVHAYGVGATPEGYNSGTRVTAAVVAVVAALRARSATWAG